MSVIRAAAALVVALGLLLVAAPARACDERVTPGCETPTSASESESQPESSFVRRVPIRETRPVRQTRSEKQVRKSEKTEQADKSQPRNRSASRRKAPVVDDENTGEEQTPAKTEPKPRAQPRVAETASAEPEFPVEIEAPSLSGARIAAMSDPVFDRDLSAEPQIAPKLSVEAKPKSSAVAEVSPTGAAERRSAAVQLALKQESERFAATQEQATRAAETVSAAPSEGSSRLTMLRTAFIAFGGLLLLGTAARLVVG